MESLFNKVAGLKAQSPATFLKGDPNTSVFSVNIAKFLKTPILTNICERRPLELPKIDTKFSTDKKHFSAPASSGKGVFTTLSNVAVMEIFLLSFSL